MVMPMDNTDNDEYKMEHGDHGYRKMNELI